MGKRYLDYSTCLREKYRCRVQKITVDAQFSCPNRDGSITHGGCTFCDPSAFSAPESVRRLGIIEQIRHGIMVSRVRQNPEKFLVYFQSGSNTHGPLSRLIKIYNEALSLPQVSGLCIGTRPDCVDEWKLDHLALLARTWDITLEYGLPSISDDTLARVNRGHDFQCLVTALEQTSVRGIQAGLHLILGFPWETREHWIRTARVISKLPVNFLKIQQLDVFRNTVLGNDYQKQKFHLFSVDEYMDLLAEFLQNLRPDIVIQRLYGHHRKEFLLSPSFELSPAQFLARFQDLLDKKEILQGQKY
ncbi:MAG: TIGR01212 family radical SAM protein [Candidatus Wallbacteria bacterium]|nr:TIGR01212 family radical SAM protein [Candidatus Wallbacteria bacterium]